MENDNLYKLVINKKTTFNYHISFARGPTADSSAKQCKGRNKVGWVGNNSHYCSLIGTDVKMSTLSLLGLTWLNN